MANHLKMAEFYAIRVLRARGWSFRRIARELGIHRETVARHLELARGSPSPGAGDALSNPAKVIAGSEQGLDPEPAKVITGEPWSRSRCAPFRQIVLGKLEQGLSAQRIWQDLVGPALHVRPDTVDASASVVAAKAQFRQLSQVVRVLVRSYHAGIERTLRHRNKEGQTGHAAIPRGLLRDAPSEEARTPATDYPTIGYALFAERADHGLPLASLARTLRKYGPCSCSRTRLCCLSGDQLVRQES